MAAGIGVALRRTVQGGALLISLGWSGAWALSLEEAEQRLASRAHVRYEFIYQHQLRQLGLPLIARGWLIISRDYGVHVRQNFPIMLEYTVTEQFIARRLPFGERKLKTQQTHPKYIRYRPLLKSFLASDYQGLAAAFALDFTDRGGDGWQLRLIPRDAELAKKFQALELTGHDYLSGVVLWDKDGEPHQVRLYNAAEIVADDHLRSYFEP